MFRIAALLIRKGLLDLHELYSQLGPSFEDMKAGYNKKLADAREKVVLLGL